MTILVQNSKKHIAVLAHAVACEQLSVGSCLFLVFRCFVDPVIMVILSRVEHLYQLALSGYLVSLHASVGEAGVEKVKVLVGNEPTPKFTGITPFIDMSLRMLYTAVDSCITTDRGHKHSNGFRSVTVI